MNEREIEGIQKFNLTDQKREEANKYAYRRLAYGFSTLPPEELSGAADAIAP
jgi:hypothetical protein